MVGSCLKDMAIISVVFFPQPVYVPFQKTFIGEGQNRSVSRVLIVLMYYRQLIITDAKTKSHLKKCKIVLTESNMNLAAKRILQNRVAGVKEL